VLNDKMDAKFLRCVFSLSTRRYRTISGDVRPMNFHMCHDPTNTAVTEWFGFETLRSGVRGNEQHTVSSEHPIQVSHQKRNRGKMRELQSASGWLHRRIRDGYHQVPCQSCIFAHSPITSIPWLGSKLLNSPRFTYASNKSSK
jgi:hypothetical protein